MTHPNDHQLQTWLDEAEHKETAAIGSHVEQCDLCQRRAEEFSSLRNAVRVWAEESVPSLDMKFTDDVMDRIAKEQTVPKAANPTPPSSTPSNVVPITAAKRSRWIAAPLVLAAAAAAAFAFSYRNAPAPHVPHHPNVHPVVAMHAPDSGTSEQLPAPVPAPVLPNSEVLAVAVADEGVSYAVVEGEDNGARYAVVLFSDRSLKKSHSVAQ